MPQAATTALMEMGDTITATTETAEMVVETAVVAETSYREA